MRAMTLRYLLPGGLALALLAGCTLTRPAPFPSAATRPPPENAAPASVAPGTPAPGSGEAVPAVPERAATPVRQFRLGTASTALVNRAHGQAGSGDFGGATATLERAQRIEPDNPLLWIELARVQLSAGNAAQADAMGHKALALASGDPAAQAASWRVIADALRAERRNAEASAADQKAQALGTR